MKQLKQIPISKIFFITITLKISSSVIGWLINDPWIFGLTIPITLMIAYIIIGVKRHPDDISDEKFGDSCYYLGFLFTISTIILILFDLPDAGLKFERIAARFGAAMVSTLLGMGARVYIVNFKKDLQEVKQTIEDSLIDTAKTFQIHLEIFVEKIKRLHEDVYTYSNKVTTQINITTEKYTENLSEIFKKINDDNAKIAEQFTTAMKTVSDSIIETTKKFEEELTKSAATLNSKIQEMNLPGDYFVKIMQEPVDNLKKEINLITSDISNLSETLKKGSGSIGNEVTNLTTDLRSWSGKISKAFEKIVKSFNDTPALIDKINNTIAGQEQILKIVDHYTKTIDNLSISIKNSISESMANINIQTQQLNDKIQNVTEGQMVTSNLIKGAPEFFNISKTTSDQLLIFQKELSKSIELIQTLIKNNNDLIQSSMKDVIGRGIFGFLRR
ncbi:MAG: hypothetical protein Q8N09_03140 [Thermodesulfovibrionia bacterium]|nr:hypothetical protein [Thermodesulfovibrionia bacterium]